MTAKEDNGQITRLKFRSKPNKSQQDISVKDTDLSEFAVMINPDSISRSLGMEKTSNRAGASKSKADVFGCLPEKISFTFYLDGTNVVPNQNNRSVSNMIKDFLSIVYQKDGKPIQALIIEYLSEELIVCTNSIEINYSLFDIKGNPLRAKINCVFSTVKDNVPQKPKPHKKSQKKQISPLCNCEEARKNNQNSIKKQTTGDANFSTVDGREIKV